MLLTLLGFGMVLTFMILIMTRRLSPLVALISIPIVFAIIGGFAPTMGGMMLDGIRKIAPTGEVTTLASKASQNPTLVFISGPAIEIGRIALADAAWAEATTQRLRAECVEIDAMAAQAGWKLAGGAELFRLYSTPNARAAQERLARHQIWSRIFPWSDTLIRLGLPSGPSEWGRLRAAMED